MPSSPFTEVGRLEMRVDQLENKVNGKVDSHELSSINTEISRLKTSLYILEETVANITYRLETAEQAIIEIKEE